MLSLSTGKASGGRRQCDLAAEAMHALVRVAASESPHRRFSSARLSPFSRAKAHQHGERQSGVHSYGSYGLLRSNGADSMASMEPLTAGGIPLDSRRVLLASSPRDTISQHLCQVDSAFEGQVQH